MRATVILDTEDTNPTGLVKSPRIHYFTGESLKVKHDEAAHVWQITNGPDVLAIFNQFHVVGITVNHDAE